MLSAFGMAFKTPELRKKIFFTLSIMALFRFGSVVPTPGVSYGNVQECLKTVQSGGLFGLINLFSGGALIKLSVFALGIMPYITSSIIIQLLTVVIPRFEALKNEGQSGTAKLTQYTRYLTIGLAVLQSTGLIAVARTPGRLFSGCSYPIIPDTTWPRIMTMVFVMTAGTAVIMCLGELITDRGVGNGMSILIFTSIAAQFPTQLWSIKLQKGLFAFLFVCAVGILVIAAVVFVELRLETLEAVLGDSGRHGRKAGRPRHVRRHPASGRRLERHPRRRRRQRAHRGQRRGGGQPPPRGSAPRHRCCSASSWRRQRRSSAESSRRMNISWQGRRLCRRRSRSRKNSKNQNRSSGGSEACDDREEEDLQHQRSR